MPPTDHAVLRLVRRPAVGAGVPDLDPVQTQVVARRAGSGPLVVVGAPGTGKTTTLVEAVAARVHRDGLDPSSVLVLAPSRVAAAALRQRVSARLAGLGPVAVGEPLARTPASYAFGLIRRSAVREGDPSPRLISGPEQDAVLRDLLEGHVDGEGTAPRWPAAVRPALALSGLRAELRELLMRAMERGLGPDGLAELGRRHGRPEWEAAATLLGEYLDVTALRSPSSFDPAAIVDEAVSLLRDDPTLLAAERARWRLVAVDDHHESVEATARLLEQLCGRGADLLVTGDPDATTGGFRGADPGAVAAAPGRYRRADGAQAPVVVLPTRWRSGPAVTEVSRRVAAAIGGGGAQVAARRAAEPGRAHDGVEVAVLGSQHAQAAYVAGLLRRAHVADDLPWGEMAVLVRSSGRTSGLRRALAAAGVPVGTASSQAPVRDEPAVRPLLLAAAASLRPDDLDALTAAELLRSPLGGADALEVRRLRQRLLARERSEGGTRASDALVVEALLDPVEAVRDARGGDDALRRVAAVLAAGRREVGAATRAAGPSAERLLWAVWDASGLGERWRAVALEGGRRGRRADRDLDAVVALFEAAQRFSERLPGAGARSFFDTLGQQDVPSDTLAERAPQHDAVAVLTPQSAAGRQWRVVVVCDVQDGVWPNTRLRGSLLGAPDLVDAVAGVHLEQQARVRAARLAVRHDELRMLHVAVTRARERLVVTAVRDADDVPSPFLDLVDPLPDGVDERRLTPVPRTTSLRAVVADLRARLLQAVSRGDAALVDELAALLARLADEGVPGADPAGWYGTDLSDATALQPADAHVTVSPSAIEKFEGCPLRWLLETSGGKDGTSGTAAGVGSIIHALAHEMASVAGDLDAVALRARLEDDLVRRWPSLGLQGWVGRKEEARARGMVGLLAGYLHDRAGVLVGTELDLRVQVGRAVITGRVDRLETDDDGRLLVVDLKTSKYPPTAERVVTNPQLGAYQVAVEEGAFGDRETGGASLVHLGRKDARSVSVQTQPPPSRADDPAWARTVVARAADGMAGAAFEARVGADCDRCPVRSSCPAQPDGEQLVPGGAR